MIRQFPIGVTVLALLCMSVSGAEKSSTWMAGGGRQNPVTKGALSESSTKRAKARDFHETQWEIVKTATQSGATTSRTNVIEEVSSGLNHRGADGVFRETDVDFKEDGVPKFSKSILIPT